MSDPQFIDDRRNSLEDAFFRSLDDKILARMKAEVEKKEAKEALRAASGIDDEEALQRLVDRGVSPKTLAALLLVPLIETAWCDGKLDADEKTAFLKVAAEEGIATDSPAYELLQLWLKAPPPLALLESWEAYVKALVPTMQPDGRAKLKERGIL